MAFEPLFTIQPQEGKNNKYGICICTKQTIISVTTPSNWVLNRHLNAVHTKKDVLMNLALCSFSY